MFGDAYADVEALYLDPSPADEETRKGGGAAARKRGRRTSSGEESELDDILADEKPEYIVRSTASRKRAMA